MKPIRHSTINFVAAALVVSGVVVVANQYATAKPQPNKTIFSSPDAENDVIPSFIGPGGKAYNANRDLKTPGFNEAKQLPSLTKEQRKQIDRVQNDLNIRLSGIREHIASLQTTLDTMKAHPYETVAVGRPGAPPEELPSADQLKRQITSLRYEIKAQQRDAASEIASLLTPQQLDEYQRMRRGELVINGSPATGTDAATTKSGDRQARRAPLSALKRLLRGKQDN